MAEAFLKYAKHLLEVNIITFHASPQNGYPNLATQISINFKEIFGPKRGEEFAMSTSLSKLHAADTLQVRKLLIAYEVDCHNVL